MVLGRLGPLRRRLVHDDRRARLQLLARLPVAGGVLPRLPAADAGLGGGARQRPAGRHPVTLACGAAALVAFHRWCRDRLDPGPAATALLCLALYPYAYYLYGAVYGDALFLLSAVAAFLAFERDHLASWPAWPVRSPPGPGSSAWPWSSVSWPG